MSKDVRICNYFFTIKGVYEKQHFWNTDLCVVFVTISIQKIDTNVMYLIFLQKPKIKQTINKLHPL